MDAQRREEKIKKKKTNKGGEGKKKKKTTQFATNVKEFLKEVICFMIMSLID